MMRAVTADIVTPLRRAADDAKRAAEAARSSYRCSFADTEREAVNEILERIEIALHRVHDRLRERSP